MNHSRLKTLSFSCSSPSWEPKKCGTATQQFCSHWTAGSNNKHLVNCGIWAEINEQHNYSMEVLLWLENFEVTDCVLVPPGHPRQLDGFCLPFQPAFSLNRSDECFLHSAIVSILSQAVSLESSSGSWQPIFSGISPSGNLVQWQPGLFVPLLLCLDSGAGSMVEILLISPQTPDCHTPSSLKTRSSNRSDTEFFLKFLVPFSLIFLCSVGIIRKLRRGSRMQADNPGCRKPGFWWSLGR